MKASQRAVLRVRFAFVAWAAWEPGDNSMSLLGRRAQMWAGSSASDYRLSVVKAPCLNRSLSLPFDAFCILVRSFSRPTKLLCSLLPVFDDFDVWIGFLNDLCYGRSYISAPA